MTSSSLAGISLDVRAPRRRVSELLDDSADPDSRFANREPQLDEPAELEPATPVEVEPEPGNPVLAEPPMADAALARTRPPRRRSEPAPEPAPDPQPTVVGEGRQHYGHPIPLGLAADIEDMRAAARVAGRPSPPNHAIVGRAFDLLPDDPDEVAALLDKHDLLSIRTAERTRKFTCAHAQPEWPGRLAVLRSQLLRRGMDIPLARIYTLAVTLAVREGG